MAWPDFTKILGTGIIHEFDTPGGKFNAIGSIGIMAWGGLRYLSIPDVAIAITAIIKGQPYRFDEPPWWEALIYLAIFLAFTIWCMYAVGDLFTKRAQAVPVRAKRPRAAAKKKKSL